MNDYELLDSGDGFKLERFGKFTLSRPSGIALWEKSTVWENVDAAFSRDEKWDFRKEWTALIAGVTMQLRTTDFGHLGVFPEHAHFWPWMQARARAFKKRHGRDMSALNLFAYSGGATLALAQADVAVCHLDSSKGMVDWARENSRLNGLETAPVRWIVDDALKFMKREVKRAKTYDAIILDPPSFGRGSKGEVFKIEDDVRDLLTQSKLLLSENPDFILFTCHTPGFTPKVMENLMQSHFKGRIDSGEMLLTPKQGCSLPSGTYGRWTYD